MSSTGATSANARDGSGSTASARLFGHLGRTRSRDVSSDTPPRMSGPHRCAARAAPEVDAHQFVRYYNHDRPHRTLRLQMPEVKLRPVNWSDPVTPGAEWTAPRLRTRRLTTAEVLPPTPP